MLVVFSIGCVPRQRVRVPSGDYHATATVPLPRERVFDAALKVAHTLGMTVRVLEKQSGLIRFENASVSEGQLDSYALYPYQFADTGMPVSTFQAWSARSARLGAGRASGVLNLNILLSERDGETAIDIRSKWVASTAQETIEVQSNGLFEHRFENGLREELGIESISFPGEESTYNIGEARSLGLRLDGQVTPTIDSVGALASRAGLSVGDVVVLVNGSPGTATNLQGALSGPGPIVITTRSGIHLKRITLVRQ